MSRVPDSAGDIEFGEPRAIEPGANRLAGDVPNLVAERLGEPKEAAHFVVALLDGENMYQTGNFFPISGGNNNSC